jgi:hypothetical protein
MIEKTIRNLSVIGSLSHNDKLLTRGETFSIHTPTSMRGMYRYFVGESREENMKEVQDCITSAKQYVLNTIAQCERQENNFLLSMQIQERMDICAQAIVSLEKSVVGLSNLVLTYREDASTYSKIEMMMNEVTLFLGHLKGMDIYSGMEKAIPNRIATRA